MKLVLIWLLAVSMSLYYVGWSKIGHSQVTAHMLAPLLGCMTIMNVAGDHAAVTERVLWHSQAHQIHDVVYLSLTQADRDMVWILQQNMESQLALEAAQDVRIRQDITVQAHVCHTHLVPLVNQAV